MNILRTRQAAITAMQSAPARQRPLLSGDCSNSSAPLVSERQFVNTGDADHIVKQLSDWRDKVNVAMLTPEELEIHNVHLRAVEVMHLI